jgi:hypothetical protein
MKLSKLERFCFEKSGWIGITTYFGQEYAFLGSPRIFFGVDNPLETNKDFP